MNPIQWHEFPTPKALDDALASTVASHLQHAIEVRGHGYLVVSGGRTPMGLFDALSTMPLPWSHITILPADERSVPLSDSNSNATLITKHLLRHHARAAHFIPLHDDDTLFSQCEATIQALPTFDVVLLGMGLDGHTASLFPCSEEIGAALADDAVSVMKLVPKSAPYARVTLTAARLLDARFHALHVVGEDKKSACFRALEVDSPLKMPICTFFNRKGRPLPVYYAP